MFSFLGSRHRIYLENQIYLTIHEYYQFIFISQSKPWKIFGNQMPRWRKQPANKLGEVWNHAIFISDPQGNVSLDLEDSRTLINDITY